MTPNLKLHQIYFKICTQDIWKVLNTDLTWASYDFLFKTYIWEDLSQTKISSDLLENLYTSQSECAEYESDISININMI